NSNDVIRSLHPREVLNSSTDTTGDIERRFHRLPGLPDLVAVGQPTGIDNGAGGASGTAKCSGQFFHQAEVLGFTQTATAADDYIGIFKRRAFAWKLDAFEDLDLL